jgi:hypothetical protein
MKNTIFHSAKSNDVETEASAAQILYKMKV